VKETFHLASERVSKRLTEIITTLPKDGTLDVVIQDHKDDRSLSQLRLKWLWMTEFGAHYGETKERSNQIYKWKCMRPILIRDDKTGVMADLFNRAAESPAMAKKFCDLIHTDEMDMGQMAESLTEFDNWAGRNGIVLTHPDDLYLAAIGESA